MNDPVSLMIHNSQGHIQCVHKVPYLFCYCTNYELISWLSPSSLNFENSSLLAYDTMQNNTWVCTQRPTWCHIAVDWKLWQHL